MSISFDLFLYDRVPASAGLSSGARWTPRCGRERARRGSRVDHLQFSGGKVARVHALRMTPEKYMIGHAPMRRNLQALFRHSRAGRCRSFSRPVTRIVTAVASKSHPMHTRDAIAGRLSPARLW
jgi:hypothetical protein